MKVRNVSATEVKWMMLTVLVVQVVVLLLAVFDYYAFTYVMVGVAGCLFQIIAISKLTGLLSQAKEEGAQEAASIVIAIVPPGGGSRPVLSPAEMSRLEQAAGEECPNPSFCPVHGPGGLLDQFGIKRTNKPPPVRKSDAN